MHAQQGFPYLSFDTLVATQALSNYTEHSRKGFYCWCMCMHIITGSMHTPVEHMHTSVEHVLSLCTFLVEHVYTSNKAYAHLNRAGAHLLKMVAFM